MSLGRSRSRAPLLALVFGFAIGAHAAHADLGTNLVSNPSFEDASGDLPAGWSITQESQPDPVAYPDARIDSAQNARTGDRFLRFTVTDAPGSTTINLDQQELIPVETGERYRLKLFYRLEQVDDYGEDSKRGRMNVRTIYYYNAEDDPSAPPNPQPFLFWGMNYEATGSGYDEPADNVWKPAQTEFVPGIAKTCVDAGPRTDAFCTVDSNCDSPDHDGDGVPDDTGTCEVTEAGKPAEWIQLRLEPNQLFQGVASVDDISVTHLVNAELEKPQASLAYDFVARICDNTSENKGQACLADADCPGIDENSDGTPDGDAFCVTNSSAVNFTAVPFNRDFSGEGAGTYGFVLDEPGLPIYGYDLYGYPNRMASNHVKSTKFRTALPVADSDYKISLYMGGYWRADPKYEVHAVSINEREVVAEEFDDTQLKEDFYFGNSEATLVTPQYVAETGRGFKVHEDYIATRYRRHDATITKEEIAAEGGVLDISVTNGFLGGVIISPTSQEAEHDAAIAAFDEGLRDEFVSYFATHQPPSEFGMPTVSGSGYALTAEDTARGYALFQRHWMDFVEWDSRPNAGEPALSGLSLAATPGEFESVTFSIWPQVSLSNVTLTVSDLQTADGQHTLPADAFRTWYLQQKPHRSNGPADSFSFIGIFLPDWGVRTLYPDITQRAWLNVKVPEGTAPGLYSGEVTLAGDGANSATVLPITLEVRPFRLRGAIQLRTLRRAGSSILLDFPSSDPDIEGAPDPAKYNREFYRKAAYQDLHDHGFVAALSPYFDGSLNQSWWDANGNFDWDAETTAGSAQHQLDRFNASPFSGNDTVFVDGAPTDRILPVFRDEPGAEWSREDVAQWLAGIESKLHGEEGFTTIYLHATAEESHYETDDNENPAESLGVLAWTEYLDFVTAYRSTGYGGSAPWPHIFSAHTCNTEWGQPLAIAHADFSFLGMFHGVRSPTPETQIAQAKETGKPYGLYGLRGRLGTGFYHWKSGASGSYHEFYAPYSGRLNDDWDNPLGADGSSSKIHGENPGWTVANYSSTGRMIGSAFWDELREGDDDNRYLVTLDYWIERFDCENSATAACSAATATRQSIRDAIPLNIDTWLASPEQLGAAGRFSRTGLSLDRPFAASEFDALRDQAATAIEALVTPDADADGVPDSLDNCTAVANPFQEDADFDGYGNHCDGDFDGDGDVDPVDAAFLLAAEGASYDDPHFDPRADLSPNDTINAEDDTLYTLQESLGTPGPSSLACAGAAPGDPGFPCLSLGNDADGDGVVDSDDNCPGDWNPSQINLCDTDEDGVFNDQDNCSHEANPNQADADFDGYGNLCDADFDGDGDVDNSDTAIFNAASGAKLGDLNFNPIVDMVASDWINTSDFTLFSQQFGATPNGPGPSGLACAGAAPDDSDYPCRSRTDDADGDGVGGASDNCPDHWNASQADTDSDGSGDACLDSDGDGLLDSVETNTGVYISPDDTGTDPHNPDTDGDNFSDGEEVARGMNPLVMRIGTLPALQPPALVTLVLLLAGLGGPLGLARKRRRAARPG